MSNARVDGTVRMKLTIAREEHPALFEALFCIKNPRRRTGRLKDLVIKGLTLELAGGTLGSIGQQAIGSLAVGTAGASGTKVGQPGTSVALMLEWDTSHS
jgi:hypothetical protein